MVVGLHLPTLFLLIILCVPPPATPHHTSFYSLTQPLGVVGIHEQQMNGKNPFCEKLDVSNGNNEHFDMGLALCQVLFLTFLNNLTTSL